MTELLYSAKYRAKKAGRDFSLEPHHVEIPTHCPVLGIPLDGSTLANAPSLDRFDSKLGYSPGNVRVISFRANQLKSDATIEEIEAILAYMSGAL